MRLRNYKRINVSIRTMSLAVLLGSFILIPKIERANADVYVSDNFFYASGVIAIGGMALYFIFSSGTRGYYSKKVKPSGTIMVASMNELDLELLNDHSNFDNLFNDGLLKIYSW